jgi:signal transduction histidine kinase
MNRRATTIPLRVWLILALGAIAIVPTITTWGLSQAVGWWQQRADQAQWASVRQAVGDDVARWHDPAWQRHASAEFAALQVEVGLVEKRGRAPGLVFATNGARHLLSIFGLAPALLTAQQKQACARAALSMRTSTDSIPALKPAPCRGSSPLPPTDASFSSYTLRQIALRDPAVPSGQDRTVGIGDIIWFRRSPGLFPAWTPQAGGLVALLLTLTAVALLLRRVVLRPLAAMSHAARQIAAGDLNIQLPLSPTREVTDVALALETMSVGLREAAERQADLEQERRLFIGAIAHDLRTPLFTLSGYLGGLKDGLARTPERAMHYVEVCQEQTAALERLIADLFAYTRVEYLEQGPRWEPLELGALLRRAVEHLRPPAADQGVALDTIGPVTPCPFMGDPQLLTRAFENLLDNAVQYTPAGGRISVCWRQATDTLVFTVEDTGPGIAAQDLPHLFTPLYRGESSRNRQTGGTGLGLTIARRILQAHGGDLTAANGPSGGAIFMGILPLKRRPGTPAP